MTPLQQVQSKLLHAKTAIENGQLGDATTHLAEAAEKMPAIAQSNIKGADYRRLSGDLQTTKNRLRFKHKQQASR